jgi:hypothetical protein
MPNLLKFIRIGKNLLSKDYFLQKIKIHEYVKDNNECKSFIIEALKCLFDLDIEVNI